MSRLSQCCIILRVFFLPQKRWLLFVVYLIGSMSSKFTIIRKLYCSYGLREIFFFVAGICLTTDIDTFLYHMNNARFMRELDFARADFYERTGLFRCIRAKNGGIALGATTIRYRRFVRLFSRYIITSKVSVSIFCFLFSSK